MAKTDNKNLIIIAKMISDFLKKEKGMLNGYETFVKGTVRPNVTAELQWLTPHARKKYTLMGLYDKQTKLQEEIKKYLAVNSLPPIEINAIDIGDDCYRTTVHFVPTGVQVKL